MGTRSGLRQMKTCQNSLLTKSLPIAVTFTTVIYHRHVTCQVHSRVLILHMNLLSQIQQVTADHICIVYTDSVASFPGPRLNEVTWE